MASRNLFKIRGIKLTFESDRQEFVDGAVDVASNAAGSVAGYLAGKSFDDSAKSIAAAESTAKTAVNLTASTGKKIILAGASTRKVSQGALTSAIASVTETSLRLDQASKDKVMKSAHAQAEKHVTPKIQKVIKRGSALKASASQAVDSYCGDTIETEEQFIKLLTAASES